MSRVHLLMLVVPLAACGGAPSGRTCAAFAGQFSGRWTMPAGCAAFSTTPITVAVTNLPDGGVDLLVGMSTYGATRDAQNGCLVSSNISPVPSVLTYDPATDTASGSKVCCQGMDPCTMKLTR